MPPLRILQVCSSLAWGGTEMHLPILAAKLMERGHAVHAVCHPKGVILKEAGARHIPACPLPLGAYFDPVATGRFVRLLRREQPDILHLHLSRDLWQTVPAARIAGCGRVILTKHIGSYVRKRDPLHTWLYRHVARIIAVSDVLNKNVRDTCPVTPDRVTTIHHALDLRKYDPAGYDARTVRDALGVPPGACLVGTVGRLSPGKGYEDFLKTARGVLDRLPDGAAHFLVVGAASYGEEGYAAAIRALARDLGLTDRVLFTGFREDVPALLSAMDLFIFPSRAEGLGATLIEAMAMGVACVSTNSDGTQDIIAHEKTGLAVRPGDVEALVEATVRLIRDRMLRDRLASAGQRHVRQHFDLNVMADKIEQVYLEALGIRSGECRVRS
jgi:glycosyltransferase involved in cell wall biosynthesis